MTVRVIVGCGYVGQEVAKIWLKGGDTVFAVTRSTARAAELAPQGIRPIVWDWRSDTLPDRNGVAMLASRTMQDDGLSVLAAVSHAPIAGVAPESNHAVGLANVQRLLLHAGPFESSQWIYLSTTGVYGPTSRGDWIDEQTPARPDRPGAITARSGEQWLESNLPNQSVVLRPAGIYGPGRVPKWQAIRDREALAIDPDSYLNLIHVADLATIIAQVSSQTMQHRLYCVCDPNPTPRRDYYSEIARIGNWPEPVFANFKSEQKDAPDSTKARGQSDTSSQPVRHTRSDGNKRISSRRIQEELQYRFLYPSYREGLRELLLGFL